MTGFRSDLRSLASRQKTSRGVSLYSRHFNRPLGRVIAAGAHSAGISPNGVTLISAALTAAALLVLALRPPSVLAGVVVWALLCLGFAFDSADGQVARLTGRSSPLGEWYDHMVDTGKMVLLHTAVLVGWYRFSDREEGWYLVVLGFQAVSVLTFVGLTTVSLLKQRHGTRTPARNRPILRAVLLLPADYGVLTLAFLLWGWPDAFATVYTALAVVNAAILALFLVRWSNELRAIPRAEQS